MAGDIFCALPGSREPSPSSTGLGPPGFDPARAAVELPFPPATLSPNARLHWRAMHKAKKAYKADCAWSLFQVPVPELGAGRIPLLITICPPDKRRRDRDNIQSSLKYGLDELAKHLGVDDYLFDPTYHFAEPCKPGKVVITIGGLA